MQCNIEWWTLDGQNPPATEHVSELQAIARQRAQERQANGLKTGALRATVGGVEYSGWWYIR